MLKINWLDFQIANPNVLPKSGISELDCMVQIKRYLGLYHPTTTILVENRGVYVLDIQDKKMYFDSSSLKPLWRIGESFSKTLIAEIVEVGDEKPRDR